MTDHLPGDADLGDDAVAQSQLQPGQETNDDKWPIGFMLTIVMVGGYLAYRLIEGLVLLVEWIF